MKRTVQPLLVVFTLLAVGPVLRAESAGRAELIARGRYLVENVGMCADCHSPRNERGELIPEQSLMGTPLGIAPTFPMPEWMPVAPPIAGLPTMTEADAVRFLREGIRPNGSRPRPPMPEFRFAEADATAVAAYLKSLAKN